MAGNDLNSVCIMFMWYAITFLISGDILLDFEMKRKKRKKSFTSRRKKGKKEAVIKQSFNVAYRCS